MQRAMLLHPAAPAAAGAFGCCCIINCSTGCLSPFCSKHVQNVTFCNEIKNIGVQILDVLLKDAVPFVFQTQSLM